MRLFGSRHFRQARCSSSKAADKHRQDQWLLPQPSDLDLASLSNGPSRPGTVCFGPCPEPRQLRCPWKAPLHIAGRACFQTAVLTSVDRFRSSSWRTLANDFGLGLFDERSRVAPLIFNLPYVNKELRGLQSYHINRSGLAPQFRATSGRVKKGTKTSDPESILDGSGHLWHLLSIACKRSLEAELQESAEDGTARVALALYGGSM